MLRAIREIQPRWVVGENVLGLVNWSNGLVFHEVQSDLEAEGYSVQPYVLPAVSVNAPHRRDRVWFVAHARNSKYSGNTREVSRKTNEEDGRWIEYSTSSEQQVQLPIESSSLFGDAADTESQRHEYKHTWDKKFSAQIKSGLYGGSSAKYGKCGDWQNFPTVPPICTGDDGISDRLDGITFPKWRNESIKAGGNAIVPQVVYQIFKTIEQYENLHKV
jgi:DNA (cytosine-5)-methyltransferase 1